MFATNISAGLLASWYFFVAKRSHPKMRPNLHLGSHVNLNFLHEIYYNSNLCVGIIYWDYILSLAVIWHQLQVIPASWPDRPPAKHVPNIIISQKRAPTDYDGGVIRTSIFAQVIAVYVDDHSSNRIIETV